MSAFKKLNQQDVFVTDYIARKSWEVSGSVTGSYNIHQLRGFSSSIAAFKYPRDSYKQQKQSLVFNSANHLYFKNSYGIGTFSGSRDVALQTTLTLSGSRHLQDEIGIINIPRQVYGVAIQPKSFELKPEANLIDRYIAEGYSSDEFTGFDEYYETPQYLYGSNPISVTDYLADESNYISESIDNQYVDIDKDQQFIHLIDDGEGRLILSGSEHSYTKPLRVVGDIIYNQGQILITDPVVARYYSTYTRPHLKWKSNQPIYTYNIYCRIKDSEMNYTFNPSAVTGSNGKLKNNVTGSDFSPYITTLGLYNDNNELLAVSKTNRPIPKSDSIETTFVVKLDI